MFHENLTNVLTLLNPINFSFIVLKFYEVNLFIVGVKKEKKHLLVSKAVNDWAKKRTRGEIFKQTTEFPTKKVNFFEKYKAKKLEL